MTECRLKFISDIVQEYQDVIADMGSEIAVKDSVIADKDSMIADMGSEIAAKDSLIADKDSMIAALKRQIADLQQNTQN